MTFRPTFALLALLAAGCVHVPQQPASVADAADTASQPAQPTAQLPIAPAPRQAAQPAVTAAAAAAAATQRAAADAGTPNRASTSAQPHAAATGQPAHLLYPGTNKLFKDLAPVVDPMLVKGERVSLNFENVSVASLASALLGDLLKLNYTIDAGGDTTVSLRTRQPLQRNQVLDVLDTVLLPHDLAIVRDNAGVYHVTKRSATVGSRPLLSSGKFKDLAGSGTVIVPLNHIAAAEMAKILTPLAPAESIVHVDDLRNLLILQGSKAQLGGWLELVEAFDVDFLSGMSLGVFVLEHANVNDVRDALQTMLGSGGGAAAAAPAASTPQGRGRAAGVQPAQNRPGAAPAPAANAQAGAQELAGAPLYGLIRVFPVERLNALVVVTPRSHLLKQVETWVRRLDRPSETMEAQLFVYPVQNTSAVHLAEMLNGLFSGGTTSAGQPGVAGGGAPRQFAPASQGLAGSSTLGGSGTTSSNSFGSLAASTSSSGSGQQANLTANVELENNIRVVADDKRNALLIRATRAEYRRIEKALLELDKAATQVLIEASIVEVGLNGGLEYGVEWFIQNSLSNGRDGLAQLNLGKNGAAKAGFSYSVNKAGVVRATLNALASTGKLRVLSNPSVLVLDNHSATILVGKQQSIKQGTTISTNNLATENIVYKDTGVMLSVTPSVNAGGLVTMDISQQVTDVGEIDESTRQRNFLTRQIQTKVAVRSGEPVVLGGVISENESAGNSGIPGLRDLPLLGALFSNNTSEFRRTELLVMLTPRVLEDDAALREASAEMRERMRALSTQSSVTPLPWLEDQIGRPGRGGESEPLRPHHIPGPGQAAPAPSGGLKYSPSMGAVRPVAAP